MNQKRKQNIVALAAFLLTVVAVVMGFLLVGCKVKSSSSQRIKLDRAESLVSDVSRGGIEVQKTQEQRVATFSAASAVQSWLTGSVDLELVTRQYNRDSLGTYLAVESTLKRKESSESGYKSELTWSFLDSILQNRIDSAISVERKRTVGTRKEHSDTRERSSRSVNSVPIALIVAVGILLFIILTRSGWGITIINIFQKVMEQKQVVDKTEIVHFVTVSEMSKASKSKVSRKHFNEVFSFAYELNFKGISLLQKEKLIKHLNAICQDGDTSALKKQHVREVTGRGGIKFLYCEGVRLTLLPFSVWGCKG